MIRRIIKIDEELCSGCGICAAACHEGAISMVEGKAKLMREDYCDGLGDCLPSCPAGAISFEEREAPAYDHGAVLANQKKQTGQPRFGGCPGSMARAIMRNHADGQASADTRSGVQQAPGMQSGVRSAPGMQSGVQQAPGMQSGVQQAPGMQSGVQPASAAQPGGLEAAWQDTGVQTFQPSELMQWPVQIKLVPLSAPYFENANLLIAADCTAFTYGSFHRDFIRNHIVLIGCPKLDEGDYSEKLMEIIKRNNIKSVKIVRMEVPCCGGIERAAKNAIQKSGKFIPWQVVTISVEGTIIE